MGRGFDGQSTDDLRGVGGYHLVNTTLLLPGSGSSGHCPFCCGTHIDPYLDLHRHAEVDSHAHTVFDSHLDPDFGLHSDSILADDPSHGDADGDTYRDADSDANRDADRHPYTYDHRHCHHDANGYRDSHSY